jgi:hypothetical protein
LYSAGFRRGSPGRGPQGQLVTDDIERHLDFALPGAVERAAAAVDDFFALQPDRPVSDNKGGSGFNDSLRTFVVARCPYSPG